MTTDYTTRSKHEARTYELTAPICSDSKASHMEVLVCNFFRAHWSGAWKLSEITGYVEWLAGTSVDWSKVEDALKSLRKKNVLRRRVVDKIPRWEVMY